MVGPLRLRGSNSAWHKAEGLSSLIRLDSPKEASVNDGIQKERCSLQYVKIDEVVDAIVSLGGWYGIGQD